MMYLRKKFVLHPTLEAVAKYTCPPRPVCSIKFCTKYCNYLHIRGITSKDKAEIKNSTSICNTNIYSGFKINDWGGGREVSRPLYIYTSTAFEKNLPIRAGCNGCRTNFFTIAETLYFGLENV